MSSSGNYVSEPPTSGKVLVRTSAGDLHIELWAKEAPRSCRNFVQLCLEGYYVGCDFHRVIPGILVQTGDPSNTGTGGESVYGEPFADELHSRLRFSHRGMVAWASLRRNDNRSQFFITLDKTPWLEQRHTIFAKVAGDSIYTAVKLGECEIGPNDCPVTPPKVLSTTVLASPFPDIIPREVKAAPIAPAPTVPKRKQAKGLVSFEENEAPADRIRSSHDVLSDSHLLKETDPELEAVRAREQKAEEHAALKRDLKARVSQKREADDTEDQDFDRFMKKKVLEQREAFSLENPHALVIQTTDSEGYLIEAGKDKVTVRKQVTADEELDSLQSSTLRLKQHRTGTSNPQVQQALRDEEQMLSPLELRRFQYRQLQRKTKGREQQTLAKLGDFMAKVQEHQKPVEELTREEQELWYNNQLHFSVDSTKAYAFNRAEEDKRKKVAQEPLDLDPQQRLKQFNDKEDRYQTAELREFLSLEHLDQVTSKHE